MRRPELLDGDSKISHALLEGAHRAHRSFAQIARVRLIARVAQSGEQLQ
jgi:hypothetical protein